MGAESCSRAIAAARWVDLELSSTQLGMLETYHRLLSEEAIIAGGLGPNEAERLWSRHIGDALLFGSGLGAARTCVDVGSGVGLPGIPLAVAYPQVRFELVDRSGRRCDLIRRVVAVLRLDNCVVVHSDIADVDKRYDSLVSRASLPPPALMIHVKRLLVDKGIATIGLSRTGQDSIASLQLPRGFRQQVVEIPADILDSPVSLLRIEPT